MLIPLGKYAAEHETAADTLRRMAVRGDFKTARKIGRNWFIDNREESPLFQSSPDTRVAYGFKTVVSLFSGCGGMDLGFTGGFNFLGTDYPETGLEIIWSNEINSSACQTYRLNIGDHIINDDIGNVLHQLPSAADVVIGGFPCQDISINGKMLGINGKRSNLYTYIIKTVETVRPKVFVAENVGGLLLKHNSLFLDKILNDFNSLGYEINYHRYNAADYGVPQTRDRVFIVGTQKGLPAFSPPPPVLNEPVTAREAIGDLETRRRDDRFSHIWSLANVSGEQGNRKLLADRPGYTIRAECHGNIHFHYSLPRRISMREAARIQSFPDTFIFPCKLRETERQIGNAVPPVLAWHVAQAVLKIQPGK
ncbi:MAG: DNA cytosine methyltransferase [Deltaproteobacteria bacterium]|nr:DNA cytosine methyltransferase [Deltaproteobacteria bacterium]